MKLLNKIRKKRERNKNYLLLKNDIINTVFKIKTKRKKVIDIFVSNFFIKILFPIFIIRLFSYFLLFKIFKRKHKPKEINNYITL